jgi:hypothetical protein
MDSTKISKLSFDESLLNRDSVYDIQVKTINPKQVYAALLRQLEDFEKEVKLPK